MPAFASLLLAPMLLAPMLLAPTAVSVVAQAPTSAVHGYGALAMAPTGDRIATLEAAAGKSHAAITLRSARDGHVLATIDPCPTCSYSGLTFSADGALAFLARDKDGVTLRIAEGSTVRAVATIPGIASTPRFSPDGRRIALLVTIGAAKEAGATQAGVRQIGEIGETSDEQRLAVFDRTGAALAAAVVNPLSPGDRYIY
jgi:tRNA(Arg) A34 adenosine deaminase TadA